MDPARYFARIGFTGPAAANASVLAVLHERHMLTVPFENLDIGRRPIVIDEEAFVRKVVEERRGGFCYELNGAFAALLRAVGFEVQLLSAAVARDAGGFGPDFDHLALLVRTDGADWLADVGFGDSFLRPLQLMPGLGQDDPAGRFRILAEGETLTLDRLTESGWTPQYRFSRTPRQLADYAAMCDYHQTSPLSSFTRRAICSLATAAGRVTLSGDRLIVTNGGTRSETTVDGDDQRRELLRERFGIELR